MYCTFEGTSSNPFIKESKGKSISLTLNNNLTLERYTTHTTACQRNAQRNTCD